MKKYSIFLFAFLLAFGFTLQVNGEGYRISVVAPQLKNKEVILGNYFYGNLYARDTVMLDNSGHGVLSQDKILPEGMYILMTSPTKYFDFIIGNDDTFEIAVKDTVDIARNINFTDAEQTEAFQNYGNFITQKREASTAAYQQFQATGDSAYFHQVQDINNQVIEHQKNTIDKYEGTAVGSILRVLQNTPTPLFEEIADTTLRKQARYYHYRNHYWDNVDLSSQALLYSPFLKQKVTAFLEETLVKNPDTIAVQVVNMIERAKGDTLTFRNMVGEMLNYAVQNKQMGMDRVTYEIATRYYLAGQTPWADSTLLADLDREVRKIQYNMLGMKSRDLRLQTFDGKPFNLHDVEGKIIVLFLYEPSCGHCKKETPELYKLYQEFKDKDVEFVVTYIGVDKEEWRKFIKEDNQFDSWINAWDPDRISNFWVYYDTSVTPGMYIINGEDKKIIAKKIDPTNLRLVLTEELK
ncbi:MAG: redoxin domain-containing protein [Prevotellaceae bacterium]|jgi:thiol-disulfide isomerase/thioredoxin|nr:redoxin domain-containing protein [Prevotellaceae bacterium]